MYKNYLEKLNFNKFSPIQEETFKIFKRKNNFVAVAPTGTGKTHAYLIPIIDSINTYLNELQATIVDPTNEIVYQIYTMLESLLDNEVRVKRYDANSNREREINWLRRNTPHIVISTPEKLNDFSDNGLDLHKVKYFVLDEADMMFDEYFLRQIDLLINKVKNSKYLLYSATINENMYNFIKKYFGIYDLVDTTNLHELKITHKFINVDFKDRLKVIDEITKVINPFLAIIFVSRKEDQINLFKYMQNLNLNVTMLSGDLSKQQRRNTLTEIHNLKYQYVVASDLAARGIDFDATHIINYDLPNHLEFFKHRSGRTGRMGKDGIVITLYDNDDRHKITRLEKMKIDINEYKITKEGLVIKDERKDEGITKKELEAIRKIPKPKQVKPNYRKRNKRKIKEALRRKRRNVKNR